MMLVFQASWSYRGLQCISNQQNEMIWRMTWILLLKILNVHLLTKKLFNQIFMINHKNVNSLESTIQVYLLWYLLWSPSQWYSL
jgi:hypothetical protein